MIKLTIKTQKNTICNNKNTNEQTLVNRCQMQATALGCHHKIQIKKYFQKIKIINYKIGQKKVFF